MGNVDAATAGRVIKAPWKYGGWRHHVTEFCMFAIILNNVYGMNFQTKVDASFMTGFRGLENHDSSGCRGLENQDS